MTHRHKYGRIELGARLLCQALPIFYVVARITVGNGMRLSLFRDDTQLPNPIFSEGQGSTSSVRGNCGTPPRGLGGTPSNSHKETKHFTLLQLKLPFDPVLLGSTLSVFTQRSV